MISERAQKGLNYSTVSSKLTNLHQKDPFNLETNKGGYVKLSAAENILCRDLVDAKFASIDWPKFEADLLLQYPNVGGEQSTLSSITAFINKYSLKDAAAISSENLTIIPGVSAGLDLLSHVLFEAGDFVLSPAPFYYHFENDFGDRGLVNVKSVETNGIDGEWAVEEFENALQKVNAQNGGKVRAIILANPQNPTGICSNLHQIRPIIQWAIGQNLFIIFDEIYDLCIYGEEGEEEKCKFESSLRLLADNLMPDGWTQKFVWLWGMSKNFSLPGIRAAILYSQNGFLLDTIRRLTVNKTWYQPNCVTQFLWRQFLDNEWFEKEFWPQNLRRLRKRRQRILEFLEENGIEYLRPMAGSFLMADLSKFLSEITIEAERELCGKFLQNKVLLTPGEILKIAKPGWFRIAFAGVDDAALEEVNLLGLNRIQTVLCELRK